MYTCVYICIHIYIYIHTYVCVYITSLRDEGAAGHMRELFCLLVVTCVLFVLFLPIHLFVDLICLLRWSLGGTTCLTQSMVACVCFIDVVCVLLLLFIVFIILLLWRLTVLLSIWLFLFICYLCVVCVFLIHLCVLHTYITYCFFRCSSPSGFCYVCVSLCCCVCCLIYRCVYVFA